jgi:hypothetical protein
MLGHCPSRGEHVTVTRTLSRVVDRVEAYIFNTLVKRFSDHLTSQSRRNALADSGRETCLFEPCPLVERDDGRRGEPKADASATAATGTAAATATPPEAAHLLHTVASRRTRA